MSTKAQQIQRRLQQALDAQRSGDLVLAEAACRQALEINPDAPNALQFLGLIQVKQGDIAAGERLMRRSLEVNPRQPHVLNNLGNLLRDQGKVKEAAGLYGQAVTQQPGYFDAWLHLAMARLDMEDYEGAREASAEAGKLKPRDPRPLNVLGLSYKGQELYDEAIAAFERALGVTPGYTRALHNLGVALRQSGKPKEAIVYYEQAGLANAEVPELQYNYGNALIDLDKVDEAIHRYRRAIALRPDFRDAHSTLNKVLWQHGRSDEYLASYKEATRTVPRNAELRLDYGAALAQIGQVVEAEAVYRDALSAVGENARLYHGLARVLASQLRPREAIDAFQRSVALDPRRVKHRASYARLLIGLERFDEALAQLAAAADVRPFDQEIIAYKGLCWRLMGDPRDGWLNDYERFVRSFKIETPPGYASLAEFNNALNRALDQLHTTKIQPADQTLLGGTQTQDSLFTRRIKEVQEVRAAIEDVVRRYIDELPDDPDHPLLCRKSKNFRFAGSWSVRLKSEGFHVNHVHPAGWISSSYYVEVPDIVNTSDNNEGWITFGESGQKLVGRDEVQKMIKPEPGMLALFPSYTFHGTIPFTSAETRTTTPFDVVPVAD